MLEYIVTVDIGFNSHSVALFDAEENFITKVAFDELSSLIKNYKLTTQNTFGIVSSVKDTNLQDIPFKYQVARRLLLHGKFQDMPVLYSEKIHDTRLVSSYFLYKLDNEKKLMIDCGNFTLLDVVETKGFSGGYILPSPNQMKNIFKYSEHFKHFVNDGPIDIQFSEDLPQDNGKSITQGLLSPYLLSIKGLIKLNNPHSIYLTGRNAEAVARFLKPFCQKNNIGMKLNHDLVHRSLCYIAKRVYR